MMEVFMSDDINNLDPNDEGLKKIFGDRFHDATQDGNIPKPTEVQKPVRAQWEPVKPDPNWLDNLKACVKHVAIFGGLSFLVFYWQQAGLMDSSVAVPTMCICTALAGLGVGKNIGGGIR
jgi:hypothetical protein